MLSEVIKGASATCWHNKDCVLCSFPSLDIYLICIGRGNAVMLCAVTDDHNIPVYGYPMIIFPISLSNNSSSEVF